MLKVSLQIKLKHEIMHFLHLAAALHTSVSFFLRVTCNNEGGNESVPAREGGS